MNVRRKPGTAPPHTLDGKLDDIAERQKAWEQGSYAAFRRRLPERYEAFTTFSGSPVNALYTPLDTRRVDYSDDVGFPGEFPYTRGAYPTMYRSRPWTMRQIAGFGTARDTNQRFKYLIAQGQSGISVDFDMPTLMGYDSDDPRSLGEVGRVGVAIDTLDDMEELFEDIDIGKISVSMTINPTAWILLCMYLAVAEKRGIPSERLAGTVQADILKEFIAQKEWIYPIRPSMRIIRDLIVYSVKNLPHYNPVNISGYHIREAGATAIQEVAFTLSDGIAYVEEVLKLGIPVDEFAPRLAFYFIAERDFFEEVAKFRAARRVWARIMKDRFGAKKAESFRLRFHCQTAGSSLTAREPHNNIARTALQALSAVLGGAQSLHTNGMDEALAIPSEEAMKIALRTQQIILEETGAANTIDPLGGSWFVESLTQQIEEQVLAYLRRIGDMGGAVAALEQHFQQRELATAAFEYQRRREKGLTAVVGTTKYRDPAISDEDIPIELYSVDPSVESAQIERVRRVRAQRDKGRVDRALAELKAAAQSDENLMPATLGAVKARATGGEIVNTLVEVFGRFVETPVF